MKDIDLKKEGETAGDIIDLQDSLNLIQNSTQEKCYKVRSQDVILL
jgi:hypothetical protein